MRMLQLRTDTWLSAAVSPGIHTGPGLSPSWCYCCWALSRRPAAVWRTRGGRIGRSSAAPSPCLHWSDSHSDSGNSALSREEPWKKSFRLSGGHHQHVSYSPHDVITGQKLRHLPFASPGCRSRAGLDSNSQMAQPCERSSFILLPWFPNFFVSSGNSNSAVQTVSLKSESLGKRNSRSIE